MYDLFSEQNISGSLKNNRVLNVSELGQVFTPQNIVENMLSLRKNFGTVLEPSCGDGAFLKNLPNAVGTNVLLTYQEPIPSDSYSSSLDNLK